MFLIREAKWLAPSVRWMVVEAPNVAARHKPGHFVIVRVVEQGERIPLTIADSIPFIPDLGIIASDDPVAADWATYQMITRAPGIPGSIAQNLDVLEKGQDKIKAITGRTPTEMLKYAQQMELGSNVFEFLSGP